MTTSDYFLLADVEDVIKAVAPIIIMVLWGVGQLMSARPKKNPPAPPPRQVPPPQVGAPGQAGKAPTLEETLRREVEEFMRRAQGRGEQQQPKRQLAKPQQPGVDPRRESRPARPAAERQAPPRRLTDAPRPIGQQQPQRSESLQPPRPVRKVTAGDSVGDHVKQHLTRSTEALASHAAHLGADVAQADERLEEHLKEKFSHQLGALQQQSVSSPEKRAVRSAVAQELFDLLGKPAGVRQVIVASEILRRPEDRWRTRRAMRG